MSTKPSASINLGLSAIPEVDSPELYGALVPVYSAIRNIMYALDSYTGNTLITPNEYAEVNRSSQLLAQKTAVLYVKLSEDVHVGHMINLWNSGGLVARKAAGGTYRAHAFALATGLVGETIPVCMFGLCQAISGLTPGTEYYLSGTAGLITPSATYQRIGVALDTNKLWFTP